MAARLLSACLALAGCHRGRAERIAHVDHVAIDGELDEPAWNHDARVHVFVRDGEEARPYSNVRFLRDADRLFLGLYAADQDIRSGEHFDVRVGGRALSVDPRGRVTPAAPDVTAAVDRDGTLDDPADEDEEWVIELAMPLPRGPFDVAVSRCDTPKDGIARCGAWASSLVP